MSGLDSLGSAYQDDDFEDEQDDEAMPEVCAAQVSPASQGQELDGSTGNADAALLMDGAPGIGASLLESCHVVQSLEGGLQNGNQPHPTKGYMRTIARVWRVTRCSRPGTGCKGACCRCLQ